MFYSLIITEEITEAPLITKTLLVFIMNFHKLKRIHSFFLHYTFPSVPFKRGGAPVLSPSPGLSGALREGWRSEIRLAESGRVGNLPGGAPYNSMHAVKA